MIAGRESKLQDFPADAETLDELIRPLGGLFKGVCLRIMHRAAWIDVCPDLWTLSSYRASIM